MTTREQLSVQRAMSDIASAERASERFADACRTGDASGIFDEGAIVEIRRATSTTVLRGSELLDAWPVFEALDVVRTVPTISGFATEHALTKEMSAVWLCDLRAGRIRRAVGWIVGE